MKYVYAALATLVVVIILAFLLLNSGGHQRVGSVSTNFRLLGPNDKVVVRHFDDPAIPNISCYASFAQTGGVAGSVGLAEDPSRFALSCVAHGPVTIPASLPEQQEIGAVSASALFKHFVLTRMVDRQTNTLVYVLISTKVLHGSPANAVSAVPAS